jgi:hypothetical protein
MRNPLMKVLVAGLIAAGTVYAGLSLGSAAAPTGMMGSMTGGGTGGMTGMGGTTRQ